MGQLTQTTAQVQSILDNSVINPMTTAGDIIVGGSQGAPARLPIGTAGQVLKVNSGATGLEWGSGGGGGGGGSGATFIEFTRTYDSMSGYTWSCIQSFMDIKDLYDSGAYLVAYYDSDPMSEYNTRYFMSMASFNYRYDSYSLKYTGMIVFSGYTGAGSYMELSMSYDQDYGSSIMTSSYTMSSGSGPGPY